MNILCLFQAKEWKWKKILKLMKREDKRDR